MRTYIALAIGMIASCAHTSEEVLSGAPDAAGGMAGSAGKVTIDAGTGATAGGGGSSNDAGLPDALDATVEKNCFTGQESCGGECKDVTSDPQNCGQCDLSCQGGPCTEGKCVPYAVATSPVTSAWNAAGLAVDDSYLYVSVVSTTRAVYRASKQGPFTQALTPLASNEPGTAGYLTPRGGSVYWITAGPHGFIELPTLSGQPGTVRRVGKDGSGLTTLHTGGELHGLSITDQHIYFTERGTHASGFADGSIRRIAHDGSGLMVLVGAQHDPMHLTTDGTHLYWIAYGTVSQGYMDGAVMRANLDGSEPTSFASGHFQSRALQLDATHVYWSNHDQWANGIWRKLKTSSPAVGDATLVTEDNDLVNEGFVVNASGVFWTLLFADWVLGHAKSGGTTQTLAAGQSQARLPAVDGESLYWVTDSTIAKTALPPF